MEDVIVLYGIAAAYIMVLAVCLRVLPGERWQIMAAVPLKNLGDRTWMGANLTYYGFFLATAVVTASTMFLTLMAALHVPVHQTLVVLSSVLGLCLPAAKLVARLVEKKKHTLTIGGASFVGLLAALPALLLVNRFLQAEIPVLPALAAMAIAYALGEGLGRIACLSFGCCYGRSVSSCHPRLRPMFRHWPAVFHGATKKVAYEGKMEGVELVPVQALSSIIYGLLFIAGLLMFALGSFTAAFCLCLIGTQLWRAASELLRADYRGAGRISSYQLMSMGAVIYSIVLALWLPSVHPPVVRLTEAALTLWTPAMILLLQLLWAAVFLYTGRSMITGATMQFHVHRHLS